MSLTTLADLLFAGGVVLAALALAGAALRRASSSVLATAVILEAVAAVGVWVAFALRHDRSLAVAAAGLTACTLAAVAALLLRRALTRVEAMDVRLAEAQTDLLASVEQEKTALGKDLQLTLARARADSRSLLEEQERQIAEERRVLVAQWEHDATAALGDKLNQVQAQIEQRLADGRRITSESPRRPRRGSRSSSSGSSRCCARSSCGSPRTPSGCRPRAKSSGPAWRGCARSCSAHARGRPRPREQ